MFLILYSPIHKAVEHQRHLLPGRGILGRKPAAAIPLHHAQPLGNGGITVIFLGDLSGIAEIALVNLPHSGRFAIARHIQNDGHQLAPGDQGILLPLVLFQDPQLIGTPVQAFQLFRHPRIVILPLADTRKASRSA